MVLIEAEDEDVEEREQENEKKPLLTTSKAEELMKVSLQCKEVGNGAYGVGDYKKAIECWSTAESNLKELKDDGMAECSDADLGLTMEKVLELDKTVCLNLAQVHLKEDNFHQALSCCETVLRQEPQHIKALYRKSSALLMASEFAAARKTLESLLEVDTENAAAKQMLESVMRKERTSQKQARKVSERMFAGLEADPRSNRPPVLQDEEDDEDEDDMFAFLRSLWNRLCCRRRKTD